MSEAVEAFEENQEAPPPSTGFGKRIDEIAQRWCSLWPYAWRCEPSSRRSRTAALMFGNSTVMRVTGRIDRDTEDLIPTAFGHAAPDVAYLLARVARDHHAIAGWRSRAERLEAALREIQAEYRGTPERTAKYRRELARIHLALHEAGLERHPVEGGDAVDSAEVAAVEAGRRCAYCDTREECGDARRCLSNSPAAHDSLRQEPGPGQCRECPHAMAQHDDRGCQVWWSVNDRQYCACLIPNPGNVVDDEYEL